MFECEARGLDQIRATNTVRVPVVYTAREARGGSPAFILLEWLEGSRSGDYGRLGEQIAALHRQGTSPQRPPAYGLDHDNYIGSTPQRNAWEIEWVTFFRDYRLKPQMELAERNHRLPAQRRQKIESLIQRLPDLLDGVERRPSLIHGDLWGGNVIPAQDGLAIIDPAVSYSDREAEIAYTELFGGFSARFYAAYQSVWPLDPGYAERRDLYNLYHLLNHLNLFGESYGYQVDSVLKFYARK
jgi:fructosamine-3-kinase